MEISSSGIGYPGPVRDSTASQPDSAQSKVVSASRRVEAPAAEIFDLLTDPARHHIFDGSESVISGRSSNPERLVLGSKFSMDMKMVVPYRMTNEVVEYEKDRLIAWRHFGHHVWRYELEPADGATLVTESFDWGVARFPPFYEWVGYPDRHKQNMTETLKRLEHHLTGR